MTAVSGSGPAYVFYFIEALERAAVELGIAPGPARQLALATFLGAAKLAKARGEDPAVLRAQVTSKGGTTERALGEMEAAGLKARFGEAVKAARDFDKNPYPSTYKPYPGAPTALIGATVFDGAGGRIEGGTVLFADGKVVGVGGADLAIPAGYTDLR